MSELIRLLRDYARTVPDRTDLHRIARDLDDIADEMDMQSDDRTPINELLEGFFMCPLCRRHKDHCECGILSGGTRIQAEWFSPEERRVLHYASRIGTVRDDGVPPRLYADGYLERTQVAPGTMGGMLTEKGEAAVAAIEIASERKG